MKKYAAPLIILGVLGIILYLIFGSSRTIAEIKSPDYVGKIVRVTGVVDNTIKIGSISGYTLKDDTGTISVSSESLPGEGETITVQGTLMDDSLLGYYIKIE